MPRSNTDFFMRSVPQQKKDWYRVSNVAENSDKKTAEVYIYDEIGGWFGVDASEFVSELRDLDVEEITLHINSPGGSVFAGIAIYNALQAHKADVKVVVDALAASAASFIAMAGDEIVMTKNATMMIHDASGAVYGNAADMEDMATILNKLSDNIASIYSGQAGGSDAEWRGLMKEETWYNAQEAVDAGLADTVLDYQDDKAEKAKNSWDLSIFNHAGRGDAPSPEEIRKKVKSITNRAKEAPVTKVATPVKNTEAPQTAPPATEPTPVETPPESVPQTPAEGDGTDETGGSGESTPPGSEPTPEAGTDGDGQPVPGTEPVAPEARLVNGVTQFIVNGVATSDIKAVQRHINVLETAAKEAKDSGRKNFVAKLAADGKIAASQVEELEELALDLSDSQWEKWSASYERAPKMSLLQRHGQQQGDPRQAAQAQDTADEVETLKAILKRHQQGGMPEAQIKRTPTYMKLQELLKNDPNQSAT